MKLFSKPFKKNWFRHLLQWGVLIAIIVTLTNIFSSGPSDPEAYCPFGGLQALGSYLANETLACSMTTLQVAIGIIFAVGIILFGKLFCGYLCPLGWASEYLYKVRGKTKIKGLQIANGTVSDKLLRSIKYILLFLIFYISVTTSELFCKNFDPYYAAATGFKGEITLWMTVIAFAILFFGSFFIKMFWCKYICPLGALSNLFKFGVAFLSLTALYAILALVGLTIPWVYLLIAACLMGYILEIVMVKPKVFPLIHVHRSEDACIDCGLCSKRCPYSLPVDTSLVTKEVDCTLCGECISVCPTDALTFNKKKSFRWLPAILVIVLFIAGLIFGSQSEIPTINERWGDNIEDVNLKTYTMDGLSSVHCFGSSKTFAAKLRQIPGVYGVSTFVKSRTANILYNPNEISEEEILGATYVPVKFKIATPPKSKDSLKVVTIYTEGMYDVSDPRNLGIQLKQFGEGKYFGVETEFSCPLTVRIYMDKDEPVDESFLKQTVEKKQLVVVANGQEKITDLNFHFEGVGDEVFTISRRDFLERQFNSYKSNYKEALEKYADLDSATLVIPFPELELPLHARNLPYLSSYLSLTDGVLRLETYLDKNDLPSITITYVPSVISIDKLWDTLSSDIWKARMTTGEILEVDAKYDFTEKRELIE